MNGPSELRAAMSKRPRSVTVISWVFIVFGGIAFLPSLLPKLADAKESTAEFISQHPVQYAHNFVGPTLSVVSGVFMLRGCNWARWLLAAWFGYSVVRNALRSPLTLVFPGLLFGIAVLFLFLPQATAFFRGTSAEPLQIPKPEETAVRTKRAAIASVASVAVLMLAGVCLAYNIGPDGPQGLGLVGLVLVFPACMVGAAGGGGFASIVVIPVLSFLQYFAIFWYVLKWRDRRRTR